jgi:hypothetical protein
VKAVTSSPPIKPRGGIVFSMPLACAHEALPLRSLFPNYSV